MDKKQIISPDGCKKECIRLIEQLGKTHGCWEVFSSLIQMFAISISNWFDFTHYDEREKLYLEEAGKYNSDELQVLVNITAQLTSAIALLANSPCDILGSIFHDMNLHNKWRGQFFTPQHICDMMAEISIGKEGFPAGNDYFSVSEPTCGSGAMILGFAKAMKKRGLSVEDSMVVTATDIDLRCVYMTYIQFSLYGIPAVVTHGNSMTMEEWSHWYTPAYLMGRWQQKLLTESSTEGNNKEAKIMNEQSELVKGYLTCIPTSDGNFRSALQRASDDELNCAIKIMENRDGNKNRILACRRELKRRLKNGGGAK